MSRQTQRGENDNDHIDGVVHELTADMAEVKTKVKYGFPLLAAYVTILKFTPPDNPTHVPKQIAVAAGDALGMAGSIAVAVAVGAIGILAALRGH